MARMSKPPPEDELDLIGSIAQEMAGKMVEDSMIYGSSSITPEYLHKKFQAKLEEKLAKKKVAVPLQAGKPEVKFFGTKEELHEKDFVYLIDAETVGKFSLKVHGSTKKVFGQVQYAEWNPFHKKGVAQVEVVQKQEPSGYVKAPNPIPKPTPHPVDTSPLAASLSGLKDRIVASKSKVEKRDKKEEEDVGITLQYSRKLDLD